MSLLAATILISGGCADWLDIPVEATEPADAVDYSDYSGADQLLAGCYAMVSSPRSVGSWAILGPMAVRGDDTEKGNSNPNDQAILAELHSFNYSNAPSFWALANAWNDQYWVIIRLNEAIAGFEKYEEAGADAEKMDEYAAQARVLRAYTYFRIARLFGAVPVFTSYEQQLESPKRSRFENVMKFIIEDMADAASYLQDRKPNEMAVKGQVTKYTAYAVQAKAAAEILDYETVLSATDAIIAAYGEGALVPDYTKVFSSEGNLSSENLYEIQYSSATNPSTSDDNYFAFQGPNHSIISVKQLPNADKPDEPVNLGGGWGFLPPSAALDRFLTGRGETVRYRTSVLKVGEYTFAGDLIVADPNMPYPSMYSGKSYNPSVFCPAGRFSWGADNSIKLIRYSDMLLLNAEAKVRLGQNGDEPFNIVRRRAGMPELTGVTFEQVMDERLAELCLEAGERYFDLARTGLAETVLPGYTPEKRFYPLPQVAIDNYKVLLEDPE